MTIRWLVEPKAYAVLVDGQPDLVDRFSGEGVLDRVHRIVLDRDGADHVAARHVVATSAAPKARTRRSGDAAQ